MEPKVNFISGEVRPAGESRLIMIPGVGIWYKNARLYMGCDWEGPEGIDIRVACGNDQGYSLKIEVVNVKSWSDEKSGHPGSVYVDLPPGTTRIHLYRQKGTEVDGVASKSDDAPCGWRIDFWD